MSQRQVARRNGGSSPRLITPQQCEHGQYAMSGWQCKRHSEQVGQFFVVVVREFERTDVSKKGMVPGFVNFRGLLIAKARRRPDSVQIVEFRPSPGKRLKYVRGHVFPAIKRPNLRGNRPPG